MEKEVSFYTSIFLVLAGIFALSFIGFQLTGFAVFEQPTQTSFNMAGAVWENVTVGSTVVLAENQTTGEYTSGFVGDGNESQWNNISVNGSQNLSVQVRICASTTNCSSSFQSANLSDLNLTGNYLQYKVMFDDSMNATSLNSVKVDYSVLSSNSSVSTLNLSISQPSGDFSTHTGIPLTFVAEGADNCWYNVNDGPNITNVTVDNCTSTSFDVSSDGSYTLNLYANNSNDSAFVSSQFTVDTTPSSSEDETEEDSQETQQTIPEPVVIRALKVLLPSDASVNPNITRTFLMSIQNVGTVTVSSCGLAPASGSDLSGWISVPEVSETFVSNTTKEFSIDITPPEGTEEGTYTLGVVVTCLGGYSKLSEFKVEVVEEKIGFELVDVRRTSEDVVRVDYVLKELTGSDQDVEIGFSLVNPSTGQVISELSESYSLEADDENDFRTEINVDQSAIPEVVNETTNETMDSEFELRVALNSQIYSSTINKKILLGAPLSGFAVFTGDFFAPGNLVTIGLLVLVLVGIFLVVRIYRKKLGERQPF